MSLRRSAPAGWLREQAEWDEEAGAPAPRTEGGDDSQAGSSEAGSSLEDIEADKMALTTLAMHLPVSRFPFPRVHSTRATVDVELTPLNSPRQLIPCPCSRLPSARSVASSRPLEV